MAKVKRGKVVRYNKWGYIFLIPFVAVYVLFQLIPLFRTFYYSFFENYRSGLTQIGPNFIGFGNYAKMLSNPDLWMYTKNTLIMWVLGFVPQIIISLLLGAWFSDPSLRLKGQRFFKITLPLLKPILIYVMITSLIGGLQMFDVPQILTNGKGDPMRSSMTLIMYLNNHLYSKNYGMSGALSVMLFIITGILSLIVFKFSNGKQDK